MVAGAGLLASCASMPTSGPVVGIEGRQVQGADQPVLVRPDPPNEGDDPVSIVDGFIDAMASYERDYEVAREFLTREAQDTWNPSAGATVYEGNKPVMEEVGESRVRLTHTLTGKLRPDRSFEPKSSGESLELRLEQVEGEWRIANPPEGLLISDFYFRRGFRAYDVYFFDPSFSVLVPDPIWVPVGMPAPATVLAQSLLAGPTEWLAPAVETAFPPSTTLSVDSVPVKSGLATVELGSEVETASPDDRARMAAQLAWTLAQVEGVEGVEATSSDTPLVSSDTGSVGLDDYRDVDPTVTKADLPVFAVSETGVVTIDGADPVPVPGPVGTDPDIRELAIDASGERAAVVDGTGATVEAVELDGSSEPELLLRGDELTSPAWDRHGTVWALGLDSVGRRVPKANVGDREVTVPVAALGNRSVSRLAPSPDGVRVALVIAGQAWVGLIIREVDARSELQIVGLRPLPVSGDVIDVAWKGAGEVAAMVTEQTEAGPETRVFEVPLDGRPAIARGSVRADAVSLAGVPRNPLVVATSEGVLLRPESGVQWPDIDGGLSAPAYPLG